MTHLSLFSGIGGIDLAAHWAGFETVAFVEKDPFCQKVLARVCGMDDGIPDRVDRTQSLGNAVCPYQVLPVVQAIADELRRVA